MSGFSEGELFTSALLRANGPCRAVQICWGVTYTQNTLLIFDMGLCLTLLGSTCLCGGPDSALRWYRAEVFLETFACM